MFTIFGIWEFLNCMLWIRLHLCNKKRYSFGIKMKVCMGARWFLPLAVGKLCSFGVLQHENWWAQKSSWFAWPWQLWHFPQWQFAYCSVEGWAFILPTLGKRIKIKLINHWEVSWFQTYKERVMPQHAQIAHINSAYLSSWVKLSWWKACTLASFYWREISIFLLFGFWFWIHDLRAHLVFHLC